MADEIEIVLPPVSTIKESASSVAFEVIYKEPESAGPARPPSPPKGDRPQSRESLDQKLKDAADRREAELKKLEEKLAKERQREKEILEKVALEEEKQRVEAAKQLEEKLQSAQENRDAIMKDLAEKLKEHALKVEEKSKLVKENREKGVCVDCRHDTESSSLTARQPAETC